MICILTRSGLVPSSREAPIGDIAITDIAGHIDRTHLARCGYISFVDDYTKQEKVLKSREGEGMIRPVQMSPALEIIKLACPWIAEDLPQAPGIPFQDDPRVALEIDQIETVRMVFPTEMIDEVQRVILSPESEWHVTRSGPLTNMDRGYSLEKRQQLWKMQRSISPNPCPE